MHFRDTLLGVVALAVFAACSAHGSSIVGAPRDTTTANAPGTPSTPTEPSSSAARGDTVFFETWENNSFSKWPDGYNATFHKIRNDAGAFAGTHYLDVAYSPGVDAGWLNTWFMPGYDSLYASVYVKFSAGWTGGTKVFGFKGSRTDDKWTAYGNAGVCPSGTDRFAALIVTEAESISPTTTSPVRFYSYYPGMAKEPDGKCWGRSGDGTEHYYAPTQLSLGAWHKIEFWVKLNTIGQSDGVQRIWIDGKLEGEWSGLQFRTSDILKLNSLPLSFSSTNSSAQHLYIDDVLVLANKASP